MVLAKLRVFVGVAVEQFDHDGRTRFRVTPDVFGLMRIRVEGVQHLKTAEASDSLVNRAHYSLSLASARVVRALGLCASL